MIFHFPYHTLTLEDISAGKINQKMFSESERHVLNFVKDWEAGQTEFSFTTSGSTGLPKSINLSRAQLMYSAQQTIHYLFPNQVPKRLLLCINPAFIGGTQVIVRALLVKADLHILTPSSTPNVPSDLEIGLASLIPLQIESLLKSEGNAFESIHNILIGGAELHIGLRKQLQAIRTTRFFETYGMTETASHVAIREVGQEDFEPIGDLQLATDDRGCLKLRGTVTNHDWIQTNDMVSVDDRKFIWLGRADWVINSGGIKVHPEKIERLIIESDSTAEVMVTSVEDATYGEKVVLVTSKPILDRLKGQIGLSDYEFPKEEFLITNWPRTAGDKVDRLAVRQWIRNNH